MINCSLVTVGFYIERLCDIHFVVNLYLKLHSDNNQIYSIRHSVMIWTIDKISAVFTTGCHTARAL